MKNLKVSDIEKMSFEEAFDELNKIIDFIENTDVSLDESISVYEMGMQLKKHCEKKLKDLNLKSDFCFFDTSHTLNQLISEIQLSMNLMLQVTVVFLAVS